MSAYTLPAVTLVEPVQLEARAAAFATRSVKRDAKAAALRLVIAMTDLTTLEGADTAERVRRLCHKALRPAEGAPPVAAVCVYPSFVDVAVRELAGTPIRVASVSTAFPSGQSPLDVRLAETRAVVDAGAHEVDMVLNRGAFLAGDHARAFDEVAAIKEASGDAHLKVILETGELGSYDTVRRATRLAIDAGADFVKTSTGKIPAASTLPIVLVMAEEVREHFLATGVRVGIKAAGGIRTSKDAWRYLVLVKETLGDAWLTPDLFRLGASSLLNDVLMQLAKLETGRYSSPPYFTES